MNTQQNPGTIFGREPALVYGLINAAIAVAVTFGLQLDANQIGAILLFTNVALAFATRQAVTANGTADARVQEALYKEPPKQDELTVAVEPIVPDASVDQPQAQGTTKPLF